MVKSEAIIHGEAEATGEDSNKLLGAGNILCLGLVLSHIVYVHLLKDISIIVFLLKDKVLYIILALSSLLEGGLQLLLFLLKSEMKEDVVKYK